MKQSRSMMKILIITFDIFLDITRRDLVGGAVASWLVRSSPDRAVRV